MRVFKTLPDAVPPDTPMTNGVRAPYPLNVLSPLVENLLSAAMLVQNLDAEEILFITKNPDEIQLTTRTRNTFIYA